MHAADVCTTQQAADILGISVTSVQQLVEAGVLDAWKTKGGHRRIPLAAIQDHMGSAVQGVNLAAARKKPGTSASVLVVEDNPMQRALYGKQIASWELQAEVRFCDNGYQALIEIARHKPDILLADIVMDGIDGYEVIRTILADLLLANMHIAMLSGMTATQLADRGGVPPGVVFFSKPINYDELRGFLRACCAAHARRTALPA